jgi:hypothetical protein
MWSQMILAAPSGGMAKISPGVPKSTPKTAGTLTARGLSLQGLPINFGICFRVERTDDTVSRSRWAHASKLKFRRPCGFQQVHVGHHWPVVTRLIAIRQQPDACNVSSPRPASDDRQADDHFYDSNDQHKRMAETSKDALRRRAQVLIPVHKQVKELIQACQSRPARKGPRERRQFSGTTRRLSVCRSFRTSGSKYCLHHTQMPRSDSALGLLNAWN